MNKFVRMIQSYLLFALPFVLICMIWGTFSSEAEILRHSTMLTKISWEILSWNLMFWFTALILFLVLLVLVPEARDRTLKRLANLQERDEREQFLTGQASRAAYISTFSLMILLLFISVFSLSVYRAPENEAVEGKRGKVYVGLNFSLLDEPKVHVSSEQQILFETKDIPLSKSAILLLLIVWQLSTFYVTARRNSLVEN